MVVSIKKYNPGFLSDAEIVASFYVREAELVSLLESLHASEGSASAHSIVVGPRGSGKTHLLLRVAAEVRRDTRLLGFYPIVFPEESYEVATVGEFWLECLNHLVEQAPEVERAGLRLSYNDLRTTVDDRNLAGRCLGTILDFADRHSKRLLLIVENLNMLFTQIAYPDAGWRLRHTLQTEPRIVLLGSATSRFDEIDHPDHALYDLFRVVTLRALNTEECDTLWSALSGQPRGSQPIRPLEILTGGNPRLIAVLAGFDKTYSFKDLMSNLFDLIDEHTEYFRSHIEALPPQERRVYLALARLWKPATANEVASQARVNVNKCSAQLGRLVNRGAVVIEGGARRRRMYYLAERMYNIYYLLRRPGAESHVVDALVRFMALYYSPDELAHIGIGMAEGLDRDDPRLLDIQSAALRNLLALPELGDLLVDVLTHDAVIGAFGSVRTPDLAESVVYALMEKARTMETEQCLEDALAYWEEVIRMSDDVGGDDLAVAKGAAVLSKIGLLNKLDRKEEAIGTVAATYFARDQHVSVDAADAIVKMHLGVDHASAHPIGIVFRAFTLLTFGEVEAAICESESALSLLENASDEDERELRGITIVMKGLLAATVGRTIGRTDAENLLFDMAEQRLDMFPTQSVDVLLQYVSTIEPAEALALIERAGALDPLQPIVVALRRELGQSPSVSRELDEVSNDVHESIVQMRKNLAAGPN
ncbi:MAG: AAA family ATPase [Dehalococcoidia bacterium]|nr:AAA family ATPase [Dehalococcoidia bacterium]